MKDITLNFVAGAVSGITTRLVTTPLDVIKIRFQLQLEPIKLKGGQHHLSKYRGTIQAFYKIVAEEGVLALWKGLVPGLVMYPVFNSLQFAVYDTTTKFLKDHLKIKNNFAQVCVDGFIGGSIASFVVQPMDVLRTRLAGQGEPKHYKSIRSAISLMYKERGLRTFYRGVTPAIFFVGPQTGLSFGFNKVYNHTWEEYIDVGKEDKGFLCRILQLFWCGSLAGITSKTICLPLDVVKKRLEVRGFEKARASFGRVGNYKGICDAFVKIWKEEKIYGFYKGAMPSIIKASLTVPITFCVYELAKAKLEAFK